MPKTRNGMKLTLNVNEQIAAIEAKHGLYGVNELLKIIDDGKPEPALAELRKAAEDRLLLAALTLS